MAFEVIKLTILDREKKVFEDTISSLTSYNDTGTFDVLTGHANFITLIRKKILIRTKQGQLLELPIDFGIMRVIDNEVKVFLGFVDFQQAEQATAEETGAEVEPVEVRAKSKVAT